MDNDREASEQGPAPGLYLHPVSGSYYIVLGLARCSTNGPREDVERSVVYYSLDRQEVKYREVSEFLTPGRFVRADGQPHRGGWRPTRAGGGGTVPPPMAPPG